MNLFGLRRPDAPPRARPVGVGAAHECARLHAAAFARGWSELEFEHLLLEANVAADGVHDPRGTGLRGFALSRLAADEAEVLTITVEAARRRSGLGRVLLSGHLSRLSALRAARVFLDVEETNAPALALYARFGFVEVGRRESYYRTGTAPPAAALVMRLDLR